MRIDSVTLRNFRNIENSTLVAHPHLNFLIGNNGQGKTSFIEAIGYLATLRSFRGAKTDEVIRWSADTSEIHCGLTASDEAGDWKTELKVQFSQSGNRASKVAFINGKAFRSSTQYLSQRFGHFELGLHAVVFNPSDHDLVRGEPALRRAYLDRVIAAEDLEYLKALQKYQRVLEQRNALLKSQDFPSRELMAGFSEPMGRLAAEIAFKRLEWLTRLQIRLNPVLHHIAPREPELKAIYVSNWVPPTTNLSSSNNSLDVVHFAGLPQLPSLEILEQSFWKQLSVLEATELRMRSSLVGPHRDDWTFLLGGQVLKGHGSQGEVRSALLALKLCEIELFRHQTGHRPLLLLDDFSSELDRERRAFLLRFLSDTDLQVFVTTTEDAFQIGQRFWVVQGRLADRKEVHDYTNG